MKKLILFAGSVLAAVVMTGCFAAHTNDAAAAADVKVQKTYTADIVAGAKTVTGEATVHNVLNIITWGVSNFADDAFVSTSGPSLQVLASPLTVAKQGATFNACQAAKADVILAAKYRIDIKDYFVYKAIKCQVIGYPGTIKGVK